MEKLTTTQVSNLLKVTPRRVQELAKKGRLKAVKFGRDWQFDREEVEEFSLVARSKGRPLKSKIIIGG